MNLIEIIGVSQLKEFLKLDKVDQDNTIIVSIIGVSDVKLAVDKIVPKAFTYYRYQVLIPGPMILNVYYREGLSEDYIKGCVGYWNKPDVLFYINEVIRIALMYDYNLAIVTSKDEEDDFKFLDMLCNRIKTMYTIKSVKFEKFKKGKSSKIKGDPEKVLELCDNLRDEIITKLNTLHITLPTNMLMRINKKTIKKFPKELRYIYEQYMED